MSVRNLLAYISLVFGGCFCSFAQSASLPAVAAQLQLRQGDSLYLEAQEGKVWLCLRPEKAVYDNLSEGVDTRHPWLS
ncbi:MAG TPA: hypothetical protein VJ953_03925 [Saprospiraceae bacterium]|nr:hypothetical protein [Saprospiraceae bacterium]